MGNGLRSGFSLFELMITTAIIGIVGLVSAPGMLGFVADYRMGRATRVLASEMNLTRMQAIARNRVCHVVFDPVAQTLSVYEDDDNDWTTANTLVKTVDLETDFPHVLLGYNIVTGVDGQAITQPAKFGTAASPVRATFLPNGMLSEPGVFYLLPAADKGVRDNRMRAIELTRAGHVAICRYAAGQSPPWEEI